MGYGAGRQCHSFPGAGGACGLPCRWPLAGDDPPVDLVHYCYNMSVTHMACPGHFRR
jgi:hypothetical protein